MVLFCFSSRDVSGTLDRPMPRRLKNNDKMPSPSSWLLQTFVIKIHSSSARTRAPAVINSANALRGESTRNPSVLRELRRRQLRRPAKMGWAVVAALRSNCQGRGERVKTTYRYREVSEQVRRPRWVEIVVTRLCWHCGLFF